jgi:hypothetical protein
MRTARPSSSELRENEPLPGDKGRPGQVVAVLELPDPLPGIPGVMACGDRPEGVGGLDDVGHGLAGSPGGAGGHADQEGDGQEQNGKAREHVFVA